MTGRIVITGATSGLGLAAARALAAQGQSVVVAARSGRQAAGQLRAELPTADIDGVTLDLGSLESVRSAAEEIRQGPPIAALVCNAGIQVVDGVRRSADGYELTFATNHLGHFLLVELLLGHLTVPGRVVVLSSEVHQGPRKSMGFPAPQWAPPDVLADPDRPGIDTTSRGGRVRYATSKLANLYFTYELARRTDPAQVTVNAFDPGLMPDTGLARTYPPLVRRAYQAATPLLVRALPGARPVTRSAGDLAWLATSPDLTGVSGTYFSGREPRQSSAESYDRERAAQLWDVSQRLVGVRPAGSAPDRSP